MTQSSVVGLTVSVVLEKSLDLHFEQPLGTVITGINEQSEFYAVGHFRQNGTDIPNATVWVYQVDVAGNPVSPVVRNSDTTDTSGKYEILFTAPDVTANETIYFKAYDDAQKPT